MSDENKLSEDLKFIERRRHERVTTAMKVNFKVMDEAEKAKVLSADSGFKDLPLDRHGKDLISVFSEDISVGGLKITSEEAIPMGASLLLEVHLEGLPADIGAAAVVVWSKKEANHYNKYTAGLRFTAINQDDINRIEKAILLEKKSQIVKRKD